MSKTVWFTASKASFHFSEPVTHLFNVSTALSYPLNESFNSSTDFLVSAALSDRAAAASCIASISFCSAWDCS